MTATTDADTRCACDTLGLLVKVSVHERNDTSLGTPEETDYVYDLLGNLAQERLPNGVVSDYDYDEMNRLVLLKVFNDDYASGTDWGFDEGNENLLANFH